MSTTGDEAMETVDSAEQPPPVVETTTPEPPVETARAESEDAAPETDTSEKPRLTSTGDDDDLASSEPHSDPLVAAAQAAAAAACAREETPPPVPKFPLIKREGHSSNNISDAEKEPPLPSSKKPSRIRRKSASLGNSTDVSKDSFDSDDSTQRPHGRKPAKRSRRSKKRLSRSPSPMPRRSKSPPLRRRSYSYSSDSDLPVNEDGEIVLKVTNLPVRPSQTSLKDGIYHEFKRHGKLESLAINEEKGSGKRYALLVYNKNEHAKRAMDATNGKRLMGSHIDVQVVKMDPKTVQQQVSSDGNEPENEQLSLSPQYDPKFQPTLQDGECSTPETEAAPDSPLSGRFQALAAVTPPPIRRHVPPGYKPMITVVRNPFNPNHLNMTGSIVDELNPRASRTLFVGNIDDRTEERLLRRTFKEFGNIVDIEVKRAMQGITNYAFLQFDSIDAVVLAIKNMDGEILGDNKIKCGFGKTVVYEVLWIDGLREEIIERDVMEQFYRYEPRRILLDPKDGKALVEFPDPAIVKNIVYENKTKVMTYLRGRIKMDFASKSLVEDFINNMVRKGLEPDWYKCPKEEKETRGRDRDLRMDREPVRESRGGLLGNEPRIIDERRYEEPPMRPAPPRESVREPRPYEIREVKIKDEDDINREELEKELTELKKENVRIMNEMSNEKATNGVIDPINIAICDNNNVLRSMEIHRALGQKPEFTVKSYGVEKKVRIAADATTEIEFDYKMSFLEIASAIAKMPQHGESFKRNGTIELLAKNRELKQGPESFINTTQRFDIVFTTEQVLIDKVISLLDKLVSKGQIPDPVPRNNGFGSTCHVINIDIGDFREDAILGAQIVSKLCDMIAALPEPDRQIPKLIKRFKKKIGIDIPHVAVQLY